jgi:hypothetical protein
VKHLATGTDLFRVICEQDMEGIVAKQSSARYTPEATTWVKIKSAWPGSRTRRRSRAPTWLRPTEQVGGEIITHDEPQQKHASSILTLEP